MPGLPATAPPVVGGISEEKARAKARVGRTINGKWRLDGLLGVGGMAAVFAATHRNGSRAALKIMHAELALDAAVRERFLREGYVANRIAHEGRVAILDDDATEAGEPFLVMELLEGETVQQLWKRKNRRLEVEEALRIAEQVLDALSAFHAEGIIHRDLKPANLFVTRQNVVKLLDFGVARMRDSGGEATRAGTALGTPSFMAPEQAMGVTEGIDGRADVFSVGASLYMLLGGQRLHHGRTDNEGFILAATQPAPSLARLAPHLPVEVIALVDRALQWDPRNRFESAQAMRTAVLQLLAPPEAVVPPPPRSTSLAPGPASIPPMRISIAPRGSVAPPAEVAGDDPAVERLSDVFRRLERLLPSVRLYGWNHPETDAKLRVAYQGVVDALRADPLSVVWTVKPYSFLHRGHSIWEPSAPFDGVPYQLFAAGIRSMQLESGISEAEYRALCEIFLLDPVRDLSPEDDVGTALWERRLEHVRTEAISAFAEGDAADREAFYEEADAIERVAARATAERIDAAEAMAMAVDTDSAVLRGQFAGGAALALDAEACRALGDQFHLTGERWTERFVDVLVEAFREVRRKNDTPLLGEALDASVRDLALGHRFDALFDLFGAAVQSLELAVPAREAQSLKAELAKAMFPPETLSLVVREALRGPGSAQTELAAYAQRVDLAAFTRGLALVLPELGPAHLAAVLDLVPRVTTAELRGLLFGFIERVVPGHEAEVIARAAALEPEAARPLLRILGAMRSPGATAALRALQASNVPFLRCEATAALAQTPEGLKDELLPLLDQPDHELRLAALGALAAHGVRGAAPILARRIQDDAFHRLSTDERRALLAALFALHPSRAELLALEGVNKHGLLTDGGGDETRALMAELLGRESQSADALEALQNAAKRRPWNGPLVREAAAAAAVLVGRRLGRAVSGGDLG